MVAGLGVAAEGVKAHRLELERWQREREERERRRWEEEERRRKEEEKIKDLEKWVANWNQSRRIREFLSEVEKAAAANPAKKTDNLSDWLSTPTPSPSTQSISPFIRARGRKTTVSPETNGLSDQTRVRGPWDLDTKPKTFLSFLW